jgi:hypothetical protein
MPHCIRWLPRAKNKRPPVTGQDREVLHALDLEALEALREAYAQQSENRDPAYLAYAPRRMWFYNFYGAGSDETQMITFPEVRPATGSTPRSYHDRAKPYWFPGLEDFERKDYPVGWDDYLEKGYVLVVAMPRTSAPDEEETISPALQAAEKRLKEAQEAQMLRKEKEARETQRLKEINELLAKIKSEERQAEEKRAEEKKAVKEERFG